MKQNIKFFFGAVGENGFKSYFDNVYDAKDGWRAYIIKGGAGTGKSSLMKKVVESVGDENTVLGLCSSDPDSLDGVVFEDKKVCILDGTAPHIVEPKFAGICETIINTGDGWDAKKLYASREDLIRVTGENGALHKTAARYLGAAARLLADNYYMQSITADFEKARSCASSLSMKKIKFGKGAKECPRFLSAVTPKGYICFYETLIELCDEIIGIEDKYGAMGSAMLEKIKEIALENNNRVIVCPYPVLPSLITQCVIIPESRVGFILCDKPLPFANRTIHTSRFCNKDLLCSLSQKLKFNKKAANAMICAAADTMKEAKLLHDKMEKFYIDAMDFSVVDKLTQKVISEII